MKIVILNECFFKEDHLNKLKQLGDLTVYNDTDSEEKAINRLKDADVAIADQFLFPINKKVLDSTNNLKFISINSTGFDRIDLESAKNKEIKVSNVPGFSTDAVAELTIGLMFAVIRRIPYQDKIMRSNPYETDPGNKEHMSLAGYNIKGKALGVIGLGQIGTRVAEMGLGLGMKVIAYNRSPRNIPNIKMVSLEELIKTADVISLNTPMSPELENLISEKEFGLMKPNAVIINTGRDKLINQAALYNALKSKKIYGAGLDTIEDFSKNNPLFTLNDTVFTTHSGFLTEESLRNMADIIVQNVEAFIQNKPINLVN